MAYFACSIYFAGIADQMQSMLYLAKVAVNKGLVFYALRDWPQAEKAFTVSSDLFHRLNDIGEALNARDGLGLTYLQQGKSAEALALFTAALQDFSQIADGSAYTMLYQELSAHWTQAQQAQASTTM